MSDATQSRLMRLGPERLTEIVVVERLGQPHPWSEGHLRRALADRDTSVWGATLGGMSVVGYAVLQRLPFEAELQAMTVAPRARRRGVAASLLRRLEEEARQWGSERLLLEVRAGNLPAIELYLRHGFVEDGRRRGYYPAGPGGREDALLMSLRL